MSIQSQLDQVLALVDRFALTGRANWTHPKREVFANELRSRLSEIRAAVGGVGETVAWWREDHVCHAHELTAANALADGYKPCVIKCEDCAWNASLCDTHGAVGGEAVPVAWLRTLDGKPDWGEDCLYDRAQEIDCGVYPADEGYDCIPLYASPTATVDVGPKDLVTVWRAMVAEADNADVSLTLKHCADELAALIGEKA